MQRELKVNFPPIAVSKGEGKTGMAPSRKITLALIFLGDCPNFCSYSWMVPVYWQWEKQLPFSGFSCRVRRWTMRSSGFGCCTTKTLSPSRGGCSREGCTWPSLMTVTPQPSTRPWLESHTVSKGAHLTKVHILQNPARVHRQNRCLFNLPATFGLAREIPSLSSFVLCFLCCDVKCCVQGHWVVIFKR